MKMCFKLNGTEICLPVPVLVDPWDRPDPRWVEGIEGIDQEIAREIQMVGTLDVLARRFPQAQQKALAGVVEESVRALTHRMPKGFTFRPHPSGPDDTGYR